MKLHHFNLTTLLLLLMGCPTLVVAETDYFELSITELLDVQITGSTLTKQNHLSVPSPVTVFTHAEIQQIGVDYLYQLLNFVPGFQFNRNSDSPSGYTFSSRGRRNSAEAREVLLLVDGRIFSDPRTGGADGSLPYFPVDQIEKIEVIRGPGSALYGTGAFSGIINIISKRDTNYVRLGAGSFGRKRVETSLKHKLDDISVHLFMNYDEDKGEDYWLSDSFEMDAKKTRDPRSITNIDAQIKYRNTQLNYAYHLAESDDFFIGSVIDNAFNQYDQMFQQFSAKQMWHTDRFKSEISIAFTSIDQDFDLTVLPEGALLALSNPPATDAFRVKANLSGERYDISLKNQWQIDKNSSTQFGLDWKSNKETRARGYNNYDLYQLAHNEFPINYYGNFNNYTMGGKEGRLKSISAYAQYLRSLQHNLDITLGMHMDDYDEISSNTHFSPRVAMVWQYNAKQALKLLYGEAFRAPSLSELGLINNPVLVGNSELTYESVKTLDLIWVASWQQDSLNVGVFNTRYEDPIVTGYEGEVRTYINGDNEEASGVEIEWNHQFYSNWYLRSSLTNFFDLPDSAFREADTMFSVINNVSFANWNWNVSAVYHSEREYARSTGGMDTLNAYWFAHTKMSWKISSQMLLAFSIKNLSNEEVLTPSQGNNLATGVPMRGREVALEWQFNF